MASRIDEFGTPTAYNHYAVGWAHAMDTPYQWTKQVASHWGGTRNGTIVHWPRGITARGEVRSQFHHVIDVAPTVLEAAGLPAADGRQRRPAEADRGRRAWRYSFDDADAAERHETQYFEMFCNRGIYHEGWTAVTRHSTPWVIGPELPAFDDDVWELYDTSTDWTQAHDLAAEHAGEARRAAAAVARSRRASTTCCRSTTAGSSASTPTSPAGRTLVKGNSQLLFGGMGRLTENSRAQHQEQVARRDRRDRRARGRRRGRDHRPGRRVRRLEPLRSRTASRRYCYNLLGLQRFKIEGDAPIPAGTHQVRMEFAYDGGGLAKGGNVTLYVDGEQGRRGPRRGDRADGLLRRRDRRRRPRHRARRSATTTRREPSASPARSTGCRSTSARTPRTPTT